MGKAEGEVDVCYGCAVKLRTKINKHLPQSLPCYLDPLGEQSFHSSSSPWTAELTGVVMMLWMLFDWLSTFILHLFPWDRDWPVAWNLKPTCDVLLYTDTRPMESHRCHALFQFYLLDPCCRQVVFSFLSFIMGEAGLATLWWLRTQLWSTMVSFCWVSLFLCFWQDSPLVLVHVSQWIWGCLFQCWLYLRPMVVPV